MKGRGLLGGVAWLVKAVGMVLLMASLLMMVPFVGEGAWNIVAGKRAFTEQMTEGAFLTVGAFSALLLASVGLMALWGAIVRALFGRRRTQEEVVRQRPAPSLVQQREQLGGLGWNAAGQGEGLLAAREEAERIALLSQDFEREGGTRSKDAGR